MQKYPKGLVLPLEKEGFTWSFETRRAGSAKLKSITCFIVDRETGKRVTSASGSDELSALRAAAKQASGMPKPMSAREMADELAKARADTESLKAKLESASKPAPKAAPKPRTLPKSDTKSDDN
ncbi:MAG: hypothetical protein P1V36_06605 [Planctomycetota bacterium]|nr:hypothetical protein [Planctomycetota bacterium]